MSHDYPASDLVPAVLLCVLGLAWAGGAAGLWWAAPVAVVVGAFLAATARFGRAERNLGLLALAALGIAGLYGMVLTATVPDSALLAPLALGTGAGIAASRLYVVARPTVERPA